MLAVVVAFWRSQLRSLAQPNGVVVEQLGAVTPSPPSPLRDDVVGPVTALSREHFGRIPVIPELSTGATDGAFVRRVGIPVYGVSALAEDPADVRAHGMDERIAITTYERAVAYWYDLAKAVATSD